MTKVVNNAHVFDVIRSFEARAAYEWSMVSSLQRPPVGSDTKIRDQLALLGTATNSRTPRGSLLSSIKPQWQATTQPGISPHSISYSIVNKLSSSPSDSSLENIETLTSQNHDENSRGLQCDFCGIGNTANVDSCVKCSNPKSARWMKITLQVCCLHAQLSNGRWFLVPHV